MPSKPEPANTSEDSANISSDELQKTEVSQIAEQLKQDLKPTETPTAEAPTETPEPPKPEGDGDTILIDKEGNLISKTDEQAPNPAPQG